jgi:hypothetical protein
MTTSIEDIFNFSIRRMLEFLGRESQKMSSSYSIRLLRSEVIALYYVQDLLDDRSIEIYNMPEYLSYINHVNTYNELLENIDIDYITEKSREYYYDNLIFIYKSPITTREVLNYINSESGQNFIRQHSNDLDYKVELLIE